MVVWIDPGHGYNENQSPNNKKYCEGNQMYFLAEKLVAELKTYGIDARSTRSKIGDNPTPEQRGKMAKNADLFLSLHSNAPGQNKDGTYSKTVTGTITFYSLAKKHTATLADKLGTEVSRLMGHYFRGYQTREHPTLAGKDYYAVIRNSIDVGCKASIIIEHGFHTNVQDSNWLLVDYNLSLLAETEAKIIAQYFDIKKPCSNTTIPSTPSEVYADGAPIKLTSDAVYTTGKAVPAIVRAVPLYSRGQVKGTSTIKFSILKTGAITGIVDKKYVITEQIPFILPKGYKFSLTSDAKYTTGKDIPLWVRILPCYVMKDDGEKITFSINKDCDVATGITYKKYIK